MKSYLSLIPISAKVRKRQNSMTIWCIVIAVFLVTTVFSMAEMAVRGEMERLQGKHGNLSFGEIMGSGMGQSIGVLAVVLSVLILLAGVLMISGSINSNVEQRTKFFGMMRCIGMSKRQIVHFVRLEALNWCKSAIPIGVVLGILSTWGLCAVMHFVVGEEFSQIPLFGVSVGGIIAGIAVGIITVLLAAKTPAKRAAKVSPIAAVSGNFAEGKRVQRTSMPRVLKIETVLGILHTRASKKNLVLMTGSFALSIILFLTFSVLTDLVDHLMPQSHATADIEIASSDSGNSIDEEWIDTIGNMEGVKRVFGRRSSLGIPATLNRQEIPSGTVDLISYDDFDLECLKKDGILKRGSDISKLYGDSKYVLATWDKDSSLQIGDTLQVGGEEMEIAGLLKYDMFSSDGMTNGKITLISSGQTFSRLTKITDYSLIMVQMTKNVSEEEVNAVCAAVGNEGTAQDIREQRTIGTYTAFMFFVYGFLVIITLVTLLNIINSISMSVSARMRQYGAMRAVGMDAHQITKMIASEAFTYALCGCFCGCVIGLLLHKGLYRVLILNHFPYAVWSFPVIPLLIILLFVFLAVFVSVYAPAKRIREISVTETINEL